ncbi:hypothetical protein FXB38_05365 [Bradyrhizobium cytisi]|uniref:Uncharacterized protein n=1 Tax=Bradyrhizobium cytisi TaxID=515489 RepID=A0A5S4X1X2_9BRAD|nr:hypothetical protein FXB38_05365 [Bradyrhizobium cytisi]
MKVNWTTSRLFALTAVVLVAAGTTMAISTSRGGPDPMLGPDWQCSRTLLLVTACSRSSVRPE